MLVLKLESKSSSVFYGVDSKISLKTQSPWPNQLTKGFVVSL
jgi:hypothetical protein